MIDFQLLLGIIGVYSLVGFLIASVLTLFAKRYIDVGDFIFCWITWPFFSAFLITEFVLELRRLIGLLLQCVWLDLQRLKNVVATFASSFERRRPH